AKRTRDARVLILGDLNAYQEEDPIDALRASGLIDLQTIQSAETFAGARLPHYSYVYRGQSGSLDHAFGTKSLAKDVIATKTWHINADEPRWLDYNEENNPKSLFQADPFRSSDHDPVLIGIRK
ncbi:MAG: endonuclease/exonuclease/phosphatase family protein, partial [Planctomycetaceae bacterium]